MTKSLGPHYFPNQGYWLHEFTDLELKPLRDEIDRMQANPKQFQDMRRDLAGNIAGSLGVSAPVIAYLEELIMPVAEAYDREFRYVKKFKNHTSNGSGRLTMSNQCWVNFQQACEFNPLHKHSGVFSWVIWLELPFLIKDQQDQGPGYMSNTPVAGAFEFSYIDALGDQSQCHLSVDSSWRNRMAIFPSKMHHCVYPFFGTDAVRISSSGNFLFDSGPPAQ